ncbi:MAG TPA: zf-HC2 domain-containing protein [Nitrospira sp.]|nr:zf-HC2 domain-containing protein [Nitrospira sp.]
MAQGEGSSIVPEITCQEITQWVSAYLDEQLGDERKHQIALHLAICAGCETYVKQIAKVRDMIALLPKAVEQPSDFHRLRQTFAARGRRLPPSGD